MDLATLTNAPREVTLAGDVYLVSALTLAEWGALSAFLKDRATDPMVEAFDHLTRARAAGRVIAEEDRKSLFEQARREARDWPPRVGSGRWFDLLQETEGASEKFLACVLRKHQPAVTDAEVARLNAAATPEESRLLVYRALGLDPAPKTGGPAGEPPQSPPTGPTTGPAGSTPSQATA